MESLLKDIGAYKNHIVTAFLNSPDILELMLGKGYTEEDAENIVYKQIFPYLYVDEVQTNTKSYLCVEVNVSSQPTASVKNMMITVWCYCHKDIMKYSKNGYLGTRADILADMAEMAIRGVARDFGIGKLKLSSVEYMYPHREYYGRQLIFRVPEFTPFRPEQ